MCVCVCVCVCVFACVRVCDCVCVRLYLCVSAHLEPLRCGLRCTEGQIGHTLLVHTHTNPCPPEGSYVFIVMQPLASSQGVRAALAVQVRPPRPSSTRRACSLSALPTQCKTFARRRHSRCRAPRHARSRRPPQGNRTAAASPAGAGEMAARRSISCRLAAFGGLRAEVSTSMTLQAPGSFIRVRMRSPCAPVRLDSKSVDFRPRHR